MWQVLSVAWSTKCDRLASTGGDGLVWVASVRQADSASVSAHSLECTGVSSACCIHTVLEVDPMSKFTNQRMRIRTHIPAPEDPRTRIPAPRYQRTRMRIFVIFFLPVDVKFSLLPAASKW